MDNLSSLPKETLLQRALQQSWYDSLYEIALEYGKLIEASPTDEICKCSWLTITKPDSTTMRVLGNTAPDCPRHSKEGLMMGFLKFLGDRRREWTIHFKPDMERLRAAVRMIREAEIPNASDD